MHGHPLNFLTPAAPKYNRRVSALTLGVTAAAGCSPPAVEPRPPHRPGRMRCPAAVAGVAPLRGGTTLRRRACHRPLRRYILLSLILCLDEANTVATGLPDPESSLCPRSAGVRSRLPGPSDRPTCASLTPPCLLLALATQPGDARTVVEELRALGLMVDVRAIGRRLRSLERSGLVRRRSVRGELAHDRRWYELTESGRHQLEASAQLIGRTSRRLEAFFSRYVACGGAGALGRFDPPLRLLGDGDAIGGSATSGRSRWEDGRPRAG
jgi:DNA-binding HxlR family transcriptional regulator